MKIISKYKDYYDYLMGIYGQDPLIVLDRRDSTVPTFFSFETVPVTLYICDKQYEGVAIGTNVYFGDKLEPFNVSPYKESDVCWIKNRDNKHLIIHKKPIKTDVNSKYNCPILMHNRYSYSNDDRHYKFPVLAQLNIASVLPPEQIWLELVDFLTKKDVVEDKRTNKEKIINAGFDLKESFRGKQT